MIRPAITDKTTLAEIGRLGLEDLRVLREGGLHVARVGRGPRGFCGSGSTIAEAIEDALRRMQNEDAKNFARPSTST